jgi:hypothetical protein
MKIFSLVLFLAFCLASCQQNAPKIETATVATPKAAVMPTAATPKTEATQPSKALPNYDAAGITDTKAFETFFTAFQTTAIEPAHKEDLASLIRFPITAAKDKKTFLANYDKIVTAAVRTAVKNQKFDALFCRDQGCMVGNGKVWFAPNEKGGFSVVGINP